MVSGQGSLHGDKGGKERQTETDRERREKRGGRGEGAKGEGRGRRETEREKRYLAINNIQSTKCNQQKVWERVMGHGLINQQTRSNFLLTSHITLSAVELIAVHTEHTRPAIEKQPLRNQ